MAIELKSDRSIVQLLHGPGQESKAMKSRNLFLRIAADGVKNFPRRSDDGIHFFLGPPGNHKFACIVGNALLYVRDVRPRAVTNRLLTFRVAAEGHCRSLQNAARNTSRSS